MRPSTSFDSMVRIETRANGTKQLDEWSCIQCWKRDMCDTHTPSAAGAELVQQAIIYTRLDHVRLTLLVEALSHPKPPAWPSPPPQEQTACFSRTDSPPRQGDEGRRSHRRGRWRTFKGVQALRVELRPPGAHLASSTVTTDEAHLVQTCPRSSKETRRLGQPGELGQYDGSSCTYTPS